MRELDTALICQTVADMVVLFLLATKLCGKKIA